MRELDLFAQYLARLRQERLQQAHAATLAMVTDKDFVHVSNRAHEAELCTRIMLALKELDRDSGEFVVKYLQ